MTDLLLCLRDVPFWWIQGPISSTRAFSLCSPVIGIQLIVLYHWDVTLLDATRDSQSDQELTDALYSGSPWAALVSNILPRMWVRVPGLPPVWQCGYRKGCLQADSILKGCLYSEDLCTQQICSSVKTVYLEVNRERWSLHLLFRGEETQMR